MPGPARSARGRTGHACQAHESETYRIIYRINEAKRVVEIHSIRHRRVAYRS